MGNNIERGASNKETDRDAHHTHFNAYVQRRLNDVREKLQQSRLHCNKIGMIRFINDITVLAESKEEFLKMLEVMEKFSRLDTTRVSKRAKQRC